jgi:hypothetical protein
VKSLSDPPARPPDHRVRLDSYRFFLASHATTDPHRLAQLEVSLQRLLDERKQENSALKATLNRQGTGLVRAGKEEIVSAIREEPEVWRKKVQSKESEQRRLECEIARLTADNADLARRAGAEAAPAGAREGRARLAEAAAAGEDAEEKWRAQQRELSVQLQRLTEAVEQAGQERQQLQLQCDSVKQRIALMVRAAKIDRKTHSQRQAELAEMDRQRAREEAAEKEEARPRKGQLAPRKPDPALLEFRARRAGAAPPKGPGEPREEEQAQACEIPEKVAAKKPAEQPPAAEKAQGGREKRGIQPAKSPAQAKSGDAAAGPPPREKAPASARGRRPDSGSDSKTSKTPRARPAPFAEEAPAKRSPKSAPDPKLPRRVAKVTSDPPPDQSNPASDPKLPCAEEVASDAPPDQSNPASNLRLPRRVAKVSSNPPPGPSKAAKAKPRRNDLNPTAQAESVASARGPKAKRPRTPAELAPGLVSGPPAPVDSANPFGDLAESEKTVGEADSGQKSLDAQMVDADKSAAEELIASDHIGELSLV